MSNKDIVVSSEKGTILNYFGLANTYNPFTNENNMQLVEDLDFKIPERTAIVDAEWVAVSTGLITTSISFLQNCTFQIVDKNSGAKITDLTNIIGEVGNTRFMPSDKQIFWFNVEGLKGTFYIHKNYCGHYLKIVSGVFISTSITSGVLNEMFERSIGVPNYITNINNTVNEQNTKINNFQNQINNINSKITKIYNAEISIFTPTWLEICSKTINIGFRGFAYLFNIRIEGQSIYYAADTFLNNIIVYKENKFDPTIKGTYIYNTVSFDNTITIVSARSISNSTFKANLVAIGV